MRRVILIAALLLAALMLGGAVALAESHAADPSPTAFTRDGSTFQRAFIVKAAEPERTHWETSRALITHPGSGFPNTLSRTELSHMGRLYHVLKIQWSRGGTTTIYFDIGPDAVPRPNQAMQLTPSRTASTSHDI